MFKSLLPLLALLGFAFSELMQAQQSKLPEPVVIDERPVLGTKSTTQLVVDQDDVLHEVLGRAPNVEQHDESGGHFSGSLGVRVATSGHLDLSQILPKKSIASLAKRRTLRNGEIVHAVIVWSYDVTDPTDNTAACSLYVFREGSEGAKLILNKFIGEEFKQLVVSEVDDDGRVQILASGRAGSNGEMYVFEVSPDGTKIDNIQRITAYDISFLERWPDLGIYVAYKASDRTECPADLLCQRTSALVWSRADHKFVEKQRESKITGAQKKDPRSR